MPADFPEAYVLLGCIGVEYHYHTSWRAVWRWMQQYGADELVQLRRGYLRKLAASKGLACLTGRRPDTRGGDVPEMRGGDPALEWVPVRRSRRTFRGDVWVHMRDGRQRPDLDEDDSLYVRPQPASLERWNAERCARVHAGRTAPTEAGVAA